MIVFIRCIKIGLVAAGMVWAVWVSELYIALARAFPAHDEASTPSVLGTLQGYAVAFGPLLIALNLLAIRWPLKKSDPQNFL